MSLSRMERRQWNRDLFLYADGSVDKHKARLMAEGYQDGYAENVCALVIEFSTVQLVLSIMNWKECVIHQMALNSAFLNRILNKDECLYMNPSEGLELGVRGEKLLKLLKAMHGFKRAPKI